MMLPTQTNNKFFLVILISNNFQLKIEAFRFYFQKYYSKLIKLRYNHFKKLLRRLHRTVIKFQNMVSTYNPCIFPSLKLPVNNFHFFVDK